VILKKESQETATWNKVNLIYLVVCVSILSWLSMPPPGNGGWRQFVILFASLTYPIFLVWLRLKVGFWRGVLQLLLILSIALLCGFAAYLLWYAYMEYKRLGSEFKLLKVLGWNFNESLEWFVVLDVVPATIIAGVSYPLGYFASRLLARKPSKIEND
jgi:hypothetical protein